MRPLIVVSLLLLGAPSAKGQESEELSFHRPEAWAMKYYTAIVLPTGMGVPEPMAVGSMRIGVEAGWIPTLSPEQRRVGFNGTKKEDLNKVPALGRLRLAVGLPGQLTADATWAPPIEVNGVTSHPISLGLGRPIVSSRGFLLGVRGYGGRHSSTGSFTCTRAAPEALAPEEETEGEEHVEGEEQHEHATDMSDCLAPSNDTLTAHYAGLETVAAYRFARARNLQTYVSASATYMLLEFQVDAQLTSEHDRDVLETRGAVYGFGGGLRYPVTDRLDIAGEAFYAPLTIRRPDDASAQVDGLFNVRGLAEIRFY